MTGYLWLRGHPGADPRPPAVVKASRVAARARSRHDWDLLLLRGAVRNLSMLVCRYALPGGFVSALGRIESVITQKIVELRARGPV